MTKAHFLPFDDQYAVPPLTEGIKYAGSKKKLLSHILWLIAKTGSRSVLDGFSGTTRVSQALAKSGYRVHCNDKSVWSEVFGNCYLNSKAPETYQGLIDHLNAVQPRDGWFTEHYGGAADAEQPTKKMPWQTHNTRKLDGIREEIDALNLETHQKNVALTSLILALDKVDSTLGHYSSYLRQWSPRSFADLKLVIPKIVWPSNEHTVTRDDVFNLADRIDVDLAYYDPPYGSNNEKMPPSRVRYSAYYHVWTTICLNDHPDLFGRVNRRFDTRDSADPCIFEEFRKSDSGRFIAVEAVERLISETRARYIVLSYSSGGRATAAELHNAISSSGRLLEVIEIDHKQNVMSGMSWTNEWLREAQEPHREFLFLIEK